MKKPSAFKALLKQADSNYSSHGNSLGKVSQDQHSATSPSANVDETITEHEVPPSKPMIIKSNS
eukprot:CAMPEP_0170513190 /NCGR_PEP_ID=MMETSP0208-20121228/67267_1 /TAXON_ID=197538 /ORGANISM="Strombidium inclinatum, Strain S3" /LENGTH=63 /DNA_ID=CAMNT_0010796901 /DNA_START=293 /DNA_END=484 /DNA_ORIENTATION=+